MADARFQVEISNTISLFCNDIYLHVISGSVQFGLSSIIVGRNIVHIKAIFCCLKSLERTNNTGTTIVTLPKHIGKILIKLFQTSSDSNFNQLFRMKELQGFKQSLMLGDQAYDDPVTILDQAFQIYQSIYSSKEG